MKRKMLSVLCAAAMTISANAATFFDVRPTDWYYDAVNYVCENGIMNGTSNTQFNPFGTTTRAMLVTILYRWAGSPAMPESNWGYPYADVDINAYYGTPVYWARMNNIVTGYSDERFAPDNAITREQLAAILYRYAGGLGVNTDTDFTPDKYYDYADYLTVSRYAAKAMSWCVNKGIINGSGDKLYPQGAVSRAEVAQVFMNADRVLNNEQMQPTPEPQPTPEIKPDNQAPSQSQPVTPPAADEIDQRPTGQSPIDEQGGYWDYDLANATFDAINDIREEHGLPRLTYSLKVQEWADIRARELWVVDERDGDISHMRPDGTPFVTVGRGCNTENALLGLISDDYFADAQENAAKWYASEGHRKNLLNTRSQTAAVSTYILDGKIYAVQLFNLLSTEKLG